MKENKFNLTSREMDVLVLTALGNNGRQVAKELNISYNTVHVHQDNIRKKLNIHKAVKLTLFAFKHGLIKVRKQRIHKLKKEYL